MRGRAIIPLVVGLGVGFVALKFFVNVLQKAKGAPTELVSVVFAAANIEPTVEIQESMVEVRRVVKDAAPDSGFSQKPEVVGRVSSWPIPKGCPIGAMQLAPKGTPPGMAVRITDGFRAVAVRIDESTGVAGWIKPGSRVDVIAMIDRMDRGANRSICKTILQNVEVLAAGTDIGKGSDTAAEVTRTVTLLVAPSDVPKLHLAENKGKLRLSMRNQRDTGLGMENSTTDNDLLSVGEGGAKAGKMDTPSFFSALLNAQAKMKAEQPDKEQQPAAASAEKASPVTPPWTVEVYKGPNAIETVRFQREANDWQRVEKQDRTANPAPAARPTNSAPPSSPSLLPAKKTLLPAADAAELYKPQAKGPELEGPARTQ